MDYFGNNQLNYFFYFCYATTQLARKLQQERAQVVCSNREARKRLARGHSRNGPLELKAYTHTCRQTKQKQNKTHIREYATWMNNTHPK